MKGKTKSKPAASSPRAAAPRTSAPVALRDIAEHFGRLHGLSGEPRVREVVGLSPSVISRIECLERVADQDADSHDDLRHQLSTALAQLEFVTNRLADLWATVHGDDSTKAT